MTDVDVCFWCLAKVEVPKNHNPHKKIVCSIGCRSAEMLFGLYYSEEEMNRRAHYYAIMRGLSDEQSEGE